MKLRLTGPNGSAECAAVLNGGFEVPEPHVLLPARLAERLVGDFRDAGQAQEMEGAGGEIQLILADAVVTGRVCAADREGHEVRFQVLVAETDAEVLVSDTGIDALGIRIESFAPGRWRFADEPTIRDSVAPQYG